MIPELETSREPAYAAPVRDLYALDLGDEGRVEIRRHGATLTTLVHTPPGGGEPAEFDLRRWSYRQWSAQTEDREYAEGLRVLLTQHSLFEHPTWVTRERPADLRPAPTVVIDDLRATWRGRFGTRQQPPGGGVQVCKACVSSEPPRGPLTVWSPSPTQQACPHRDAAARALLALADQHAELVFELLDLLVVAQTPGANGAPTLRRFVLPNEWMRALLGHWLLGQDYLQGSRSWRSRGAPRHRRHAHRVTRQEVSSELSDAERHALLAWGIAQEDLEQSPAVADENAPDAAWWTDPAPPTLGARIYPEGSSPRPSAPEAPPERTKVTRVTPLRVAREPVPVEAPSPPAPRVEPKRTPRATVTKAKRAASAKGRASKAQLESEVSSLTAGLAALSQLMGGAKGGRR